MSQTVTGADVPVTPLSVISVDDNPMIGDVVALMLADLRQLRHVRHFVSGSGVLEHVRREGISLVVLDYEIPGTDTLALLRGIVTDCPDCKVMMLSAHGRPDIIEGCRRCGAAAYVLKTDAPENIVDMIRRVAAGERLLGNR